MAQRKITDFLKPAKHPFTGITAKKKDDAKTKIDAATTTGDGEASSSALAWVVSNTTANGEEPTFTLFNRLPLEIRRMIWRLSVPTRIVKVDHEIKNHPKQPPAWGTITVRVGNSWTVISDSDFKMPPTRQNIHESYPALLSVCVESRRETKPLYRSTFPEPKIGPSAWHLDYIKNEHFVWNVAWHLLPKLDRKTTTLKLAIEKIEELINDPSSQIKVQDVEQYATYYPIPKKTVTPAFFSPEDDILYLHLSGRRGNFLPRLWSPVGKRHVQKISLLAIQLQRLGSSYSWGWKDFHPYKSLRGVEELWLVFTEDQEVIHIVPDATKRLEPGKWTFSWELDCAISKQLAEDKMEPVTWHVALGCTEGKNEKTFWEQANAWRPELGVWEMDKRRIMKRQPVPQKWKDTKRFRHRLPTNVRAPVVLPGGDGHTWLGMSKGDQWVVWGERGFD